MRNLSESVDTFGLPFEEAKKKKDEPNYEKLLNDLLAAVDNHMQVMSGAAEEGVEDNLEACLADVKAALNPEEEEGEGENKEVDGQELEPEMSESVASKKKVVSEASEQVDQENPHAIPAHTNEAGEKSIADELEAIVDRSSVAIVLENLIAVCVEKSEHIDSDWQDNPLAKKWVNAGQVIDKACTRVKALGV